MQLGGAELSCAIFAYARMRGANLRDAWRQPK